MEGTCQNVNSSCKFDNFCLFVCLVGWLLFPMSVPLQLCVTTLNNNNNNNKLFPYWKVVAGKLIWGIGVDKE